ncbi:MAG: type II secretion system protein, partial [Oligoflexia bacterium]|nr:type II secretion system protein [Oligoflexia bacterium]
MISKNKAFSLIELLVTLVIIGVLSLFGIKLYTEQKKNNIIRMTQAEMTEVLKYAKMAKITDGGYHQFLYQMGYTPKGKIFSAVGTRASNTAPCCRPSASNDPYGYPSLGTSPCVRTIGSANSYTISQGQSCGMGFICCNNSTCASSNRCELGRCNSSSCTCAGQNSVKSYTYY